MTILEFPLLTVSDEIEKLTQQLIVQLEVLKRLPVETTHKKYVFHEQILRSSLFSARIEGNQLTLIQAKQANLASSQDQAKLEISNVLKALRAISTLPSQLSIQHWLDIHQVVMSNLSPEAGKLRREPSAIFDQFGTIVYLTPNPAELQAMMSVWFAQTSNLGNQTTSPAQKLVLAAALHYYFEKIHPFIDGNGRTGRVFLHYHLQQTGLFHECLIPIDQYFEEHKTTYYAHLEKNTRQLHDFYLFVLKGLVEKTEQVLDELTMAPVASVTPPVPKLTSILPRRQEILAIITDHPFCSLDSIKRRFPTIPIRTIAYDVNWLVKQGWVEKNGSTRGARYTAQPPNNSNPN